MPPAVHTLKPSESFEYYTETVYWNDFPAVQAHLNRLATGHSTTDWMKLLERYPPAQKLLSLNCGNGWVEREVCKRGYARSIVGTDISAPLLEQARQLAQQAGLAAQYVVMDANKASLGGLGFDAVLNHAALHHVAYIDHLVREILINLPPDGLLINYDYVGAHRNQYRWEAWSRMMELWDQLPPTLRTDLRYPHLQTMLATDPTEAVHAELIVKTLERYFDIVEQKVLGGAIAYQLLWNNRALHNARNTEHGFYWIERILEEDSEYTDNKIENSLFAVLICRPKKHVLNDEAQLAEWTRQEVERERLASENDGRYQPRNALEIIYYQK